MGDNILQPSRLCYRVKQGAPSFEACAKKTEAIGTGLSSNLGAAAQQVLWTLPGTTQSASKRHRPDVREALSHHSLAHL